MEEWSLSVGLLSYLRSMTSAWGKSFERNTKVASDWFLALKLEMLIVVQLVPFLIFTSEGTWVVRFMVIYSS